MNLSKKFKKKLRNHISLAIVLVVTLGTIFVLGTNNQLTQKLANLKNEQERKGGETGSQQQELVTFREEQPKEQEVNNTTQKESDRSQSTTTLAMEEPTLNLTTNSQIKNQEDLIQNAAVASGNTFGSVLKADGTVWTWGNNQYGQLGNGEIENVNETEPKQVIGIDGIGKLENIKQITVGGFFEAALTNDGRVVAWGINNYGQLGRQDTANSGIPSYVVDETGKQIANIKQISAGASHMLAVTEGGEVLAWGLNNYGELGINTASTTTSNAEFKRTYAVNVKKSIEITNDDGTTTNQLVNLDNIKQVSGGTDFSVALTNDGQVYCFGLGTSGQIGNNVAANTAVATKTNIEDVQKIDAGGLQTIALKQDGTVWGWGINRYGNLGINTSSTDAKNAAYKKAIPVQVLVAAGQPLTDVVDISSIEESSYAVTNSGNVYAWGRNNYATNETGQLGDYTTANKTVATKMLTHGKEELKHIKLLADGQNTRTNMVVDKDGTIYMTGKVANGKTMTDIAVNLYYAKKINETYLELSANQEYIEMGSTLPLRVSYHNGMNVLGDKTPETIQYRSSNENIATVDQNGVVSAKKRGTVTIIAENTSNGDIAQSIIHVVSPNAVAIPNVVSGTTFTAMLKEDGTVWTTGANTVGELGNGSSINSTVPTQVKIDTNTYLTDIRKIEVGTQHVIALRKDGTVWGWGLNTSGQLGDGTSNSKNYAVQVVSPDGSEKLTDVADISTGYDFSLAVMKDKTVYAWGVGANHPFGVNSTGNQIKPVKMHDSYNVIQAQGQNDTSIVLKADGTVWGTGYNNVGQLGDNSTSTRAELTPTHNQTMDGALTGVVRITSGLHFTIALKEDKTAWVWGQNNQGQFGVATPTSSKYPMEFAGSNIQNIGTGPYATYIEDTDGNIWATGLNTTGELSIGNGKKTVKELTVVKDETGANNIPGVATLGRSMATTYGFALSDGSVGITGQGTSGQHGNGSVVASENITKIEDGKISVDDLYEIEPNETAKIQINRKENFNLNLVNTIKMPEATIQYTSQDESIATVSPDGMITGKSKGKTGILVRDETNNLECVANVIVGKRDLSNISKIVSADNFTALLKQDGTVWTWGNNSNGQLGNGKIENKNEIEPQQVLGLDGIGYLNEVIDIAAGSNFVVALRKNGEVVTWGKNEFGQLGTTNGTASNPVRVQETGGNNLKGAIQVSAARDHAAALKADGTVWVWGRNDYGQLGQNHKNNSIYALPVKDSTGTGILRDITEVRVGGAFVATVTKQGTVYTWGCGSYGRLGNGGTGHKLLPVLATGVNDVKKVVVGHYHVVVLKNDGTVWSWGFNRYGQLGIGASSTSSSNANYQKTTQMQVKLDASHFLTDVIDIGATLETSYALTADGTAYGWGLNTEGEIADATIANKNYPTKMLRSYKEELETKIAKLQCDSANSYTNYVIKADGTILGSGRNTSGQMMYTSNYKYLNRIDDIMNSYLEITDRISYVKQGEEKQLQTQVVENLNVNATAPAISNITWESTNPDVATVDTQGKVTAKKTGIATIIAKEDQWGYTAQAKIYVTSNEENTITAPMVVQGTSFTAVLKADGTVWTAGLNSNGRLGVGDTTYRGELTRVKIDATTELSQVTRIAAGASHMLAVTQNGDVYAWGLGTSGQLGQGDTQNSNYAIKVQNLSNVIDVAAGAAHSVALTKDGKMYTWGAGANYRLGNNAGANQTLPIYVYRSQNIVEISAGAIHTVALSGDGMAWGVGGGANGQVGTNETVDKCVLIEMQNGTNAERVKNIISIKAGGNHNLALTKEGKVYVGGLNTSGQLALGNTNQSNVLVEATAINDEGTVVPLENIASISAGNATSFAVGKDGTAYSAGLNSAGQLAQGNNSSPIQRFKKANTPKVDYAAQGEGNTINSGFIATNGKVYTAGTGTDGQLADGKFQNSYEPVIVGNNEIQVKDINVKLSIGEEYTVVPKLVQGMNVYNYEDEIRNVSYASNNTKVATVDNLGKITAVSTGSAIIEIKDLDNNIVKHIKVDVVYQKDFAEPDVSSGLNFTISLKSDGSVWSWGNGTSRKTRNRKYKQPN